jgi:hypothetical protein
MGTSSPSRSRTSWSVLWNSKERNSKMMSVREKVTIGLRIPVQEDAASARMRHAAAISHSRRPLDNWVRDAMEGLLKSAPRPCSSPTTAGQPSPPPPRRRHHRPAGHAAPAGGPERDQLQEHGAAQFPSYQYRPLRSSMPTSHGHATGHRKHGSIRTDRAGRHLSRRPQFVTANPFESPGPRALPPSAPIRARGAPRREHVS